MRNVPFEKTVHWPHPALTSRAWDYGELSGAFISDAKFKGAPQNLKEPK